MKVTASLAVAFEQRMIFFFVFAISTSRPSSDQSTSSSQPRLQESLPSSSGRAGVRLHLERPADSGLESRPSPRAAAIQSKQLGLPSTYPKKVSFREKCPNSILRDRPTRLSTPVTGRRSGVGPEKISSTIAKADLT
jgi:hypothetical protein